MSEDQSSVVTLKVRVTPEFREKIIETAKANNRSMNAEIVHRLEKTFLADNAVNELHNLPTPKGFSTSATDTQAIPAYKRVVNDPRERRRLAKLTAERAIQDMSASDLVDVLFNKLNSESTRLTVEEIKKNEEPREKAKNEADKKAP